MIPRRYEKVHRCVLDLAGQGVGRLNLARRTVPLIRVQHEQSRTFRTPRNRTFELRDPSGKSRGALTLFVIAAHTYCIETPHVKPAHFQNTGLRIEETIKRGLAKFRAKPGQKNVLRYSVDVEPLDASALRRNRTLWRATVSELVHPDDIPDST